MDRRSEQTIPPLDENEVLEMIDRLDTAEEATNSSDQRRAVRHARELLSRLPSVPQFGTDDVAAQIVGGFLLSAPFVVTEEVWSLAASMTLLQTTITVLIALAIGYGALFEAEDRDRESERSIGGIPLRFVSLVVVSYASVVILVLVFDAPDTFGATTSTTVTAVCIGAIFGVAGAATADNLF